MATEKRLIDANAYPCQTCEVSYCYQNCNKFKKWFESTVDAVEVVRCKDCTRYKKGYCTIRKDGWGATLMVGMTDYCSDGERKDNEQT
jgi:hypothetical protein